MVQTKIFKNENGISQKSKHDDGILQTLDYKIFKRITGNRKLDNRHVNKLIESMKENDLKIPIVVNQKFQIVDGQHRLEARKALSLPVYYVVINGLGLRETQSANVNNKNWLPDDFLKSYVEQNYPHYLVYQEFKENYKFGHNETMFILCGENSWNLTMKFRQGNFVVDDLERAREFAEKIHKCGKYYKGYKRRGFVLAMMIAVKNEKFDFDEFLIKLSYQSLKMVDCTNRNQYIKLIEEIYNYKRKPENKIRFI